MEQQLGPLKDLIKQIAADPSKMPLDPEKFKDLMKDDNFKTALKDWARQDPQLKEALTEWLKENPADGQPANVKQFQDELKRVLDADPRAIKRKDLTVKIEEPKAKPESLAKVTERAMKRAENTGLGDWLRDSPAWNRALGDLRSSIGNPDAERFKLGDWQEHLRLPDDGAWKFGEG